MTKQTLQNILEAAVNDLLISIWTNTADRLQKRAEVGVDCRYSAERVRNYTYKLRSWINRVYGKDRQEFVALLRREGVKWVKFRQKNKREADRSCSYDCTPRRPGQPQSV